MRVAVYNQMFGLNGKSLFGNVIGHWAVHYQENPLKVSSRQDLGATVDTIVSSDADIVGINEILEGQEEELKRLLSDKSYNCFFGMGHRTKYSNLCVQNAIASRMKGERFYCSEFPVEKGIGGGGGFVSSFNDDLNLTAVNVHMAHSKRDRLYESQMEYLHDYLGPIINSGDPIILMGDFNKSYDELKEEFRNFELASFCLKSCSTTPVLKWFVNKDVDHIFVRGFEVDGCGVIEGRSDHRLVWGDLG